MEREKRTAPRESEEPTATEEIESHPTRVVNRDYFRPYSGVVHPDAETERLRRPIGCLKPYRFALCSAHGSNSGRRCTCRSN